jgi:glycosyltransferase involved in cell wall biosynthesis
MSVSYLISSYNKAEYLAAVLDSVIHELDATGGEVVIIDDGSRDSSWSLIQQFSTRDSRIRCRRQENRGIFNVTNQLIRSASQSWLRIIDCDDPPIKGSTATLIKIAEDNRADYIFGTSAPYGPEPLSDKRAKSWQKAPTCITILHDPIRYAIRDYDHVPSTTLIRRVSVPVDMVLNESLISCQDLALALPVFERARVVRITVPVCHQLTGSSKRLSANEALTYVQTIQIIKEYGATNFEDKHRYMAARKIVSRALRWMRHKDMISNSPVLYAKLVLLYCTLMIASPKRWERYLDSAALAYVDFLPADRRIY